MSATSEEKRTVKQHLPLIARLSDRQLREQVVELWVRMWREGSFTDLAEAPVFRWPGCEETLLRHTNVVARMTLAAAREFEKTYGLTLNWDLLLAGALLHDVDKLVILERKDGATVLSRLGQKVVHGAYGAKAAEEMGLPAEIVNTIACHSPLHPSAAPATSEAVLVACCDKAAADAYEKLLSRKSA